MEIRHMIWEDVMKRNGIGRERSCELKTQKGVMRISGKRDMLDSIDGIGAQNIISFKELGELMKRF
jgi:hypothetical protein